MMFPALLPVLTTSCFTTGCVSVMVVAYDTPFLMPPLLPDAIYELCRAEMYPVWAENL